MTEKIRQICTTINIMYLITGILSLIIFIWLLPDIQSVATSNFDDGKWLDADIYIINNVFIPLFFTTIILMFIEFIIKLININK